MENERHPGAASSSLIVTVGTGPCGAGGAGGAGGACGTGRAGEAGGTSGRGKDPLGSCSSSNRIAP